MIPVLSTILPHTLDPPSVRRGEEHWHERANASGERQIIEFAADSLADAAIGPLLRTIFAHSPFLTQELIGNIPFARNVLESGPDAVFDRLVGETAALPGIPSYTMLSPRAAVRAGLLVMRAQVRPSGAGVAAWIATLQCTMQPVDNSELAYQLGRLLGSAIGREINQSPM